MSNASRKIHVAFVDGRYSAVHSVQTFANIAQSVLVVAHLAFGAGTFTRYPMFRGLCSHLNTRRGGRQGHQHVQEVSVHLTQEIILRLTQHVKYLSCFLIVIGRK